MLFTVFAITNYFDFLYFLFIGYVFKNSISHRIVLLAFNKLATKTRYFYIFQDFYILYIYSLVLLILYPWCGAPNVGVSSSSLVVFVMTTSLVASSKNISYLFMACFNICTHPCICSASCVVLLISEYLMYALIFVAIHSSNGFSNLFTHSSIWRRPFHC